jgi:hypothetical protein
MKIFGFITIVVIVLIAVLVAVDVATAPAPTRGQCLLDRRIVLPDVCLNSCNPPFDCTSTTRPYGWFFTQAATCMDAVICG